LDQLLQNLVDKVRLYKLTILWIFYIKKVCI